jgi:Zn-dependent oligopeptidase
LDLALHVQTEHWKEITSEVWKQYMQPFNLNKTDQHVCSWTDVICGVQSGSCYANQWNQVLAADLFAAYLESSNRKKTLSEYTSKFLLNAGRQPLRQTFAEFRGRDPLLNSYLDLSRLGSLDQPFPLLD